MGIMSTMGQPGALLPASPLTPIPEHACTVSLCLSSSSLALAPTLQALKQALEEQEARDLHDVYTEDAVTAADAPMLKEVGEHSNTKRNEHVAEEGPVGDSDFTSF